MLVFCEMKKTFQRCLILNFPLEKEVAFSILSPLIKCFCICLQQAGIQIPVIQSGMKFGWRTPQVLFAFFVVV